MTDVLQPVVNEVRTKAEYLALADAHLRRAGSELGVERFESVKRFMDFDKHTPTAQAALDAARIAIDLADRAPTE